MNPFPGLLSRITPNTQLTPDSPHTNHSPTVVERLFRSTGTLAYADGRHMYVAQPISSTPSASSIFTNLIPSHRNGVKFVPYGSYIQNMSHFFGYTPRCVRLPRENFWAPWAITGVFGAITLASHWEPFHSYIYNNFSLSYRTRHRPLPYLASALTHFSIPHLMFNAIAMNSFAQGVGGKSNAYFFKLFALLAVASSSISMAITAGLKSALKAARRPYHNILIPSVGASGVITAMISIAAMSNPTTQVGIILLPFSFNIVSAWKVMMMLDTAGLIASCAGYHTRLSHAGHIGGYISGYLFASYYRSKYHSHFRENTYLAFHDWIEVTSKITNDDVSAANRGIRFSG